MLPSKNKGVMKKLVLVLLLVIFTGSVNAQRKSQLTQEQLKVALAKATIMKRTGAVITISGCMLDGIGLILLDSRKVIGTTGVWGRRNVYEKNGGGWCLLAGIATTAVGIPTWITGGTKKKNINNKLATFNFSSSETGIGLKIRF
jgi:hypothetical protein